MTQSNFGEPAQDPSMPLSFTIKLLHAALSFALLQSNECKKRATDPEFNEDLTVPEAMEFLVSQRRLRRRLIMAPLQLSSCVLR